MVKHSQKFANSLGLRIEAMMLCRSYLLLSWIGGMRCRVPGVRRLNGQLAMWLQPATAVAVAASPLRHAVKSSSSSHDLLQDLKRAPCST